MNKITLYGLILFFISLLSCIDEDPYPGYVNSLEIDRAWQFLNNISVYVDRVPTRTDAQNFSTPESLVLSINDTIRYPSPNDNYVAYFTYYTADWRMMSSPIDSSTASRSRGSENLYCERLSDSILYVLVPTFMSDVATEMKHCTMIDSKISSVILDLRWNGGGYVSVCTTMVDIILPKNLGYLNTIYRDDNASSAKLDTVLWTTSNSAKSNWEGKRYVILMNRWTASASEIVIAGVRDNLTNCETLGDTTFGKGIGQGHYYFSATSGGGMSITSLRFYRKNGAFYHNVGIVPDTVVPKDEWDITGLNQVVAAASILDKEFDPVANSVSLQAISKSVRDAHFSGSRGINNSKINYSKYSDPKAIVEEIFSAEDFLK